MVGKSRRDNKGEEGNHDAGKKKELKKVKEGDKMAREERQQERETDVTKLSGRE